ncbi:MAG: tetrapyrrole methylase [Spirochaetes bacterium]|nr:tetrapyrrole methylase [Spirochaetota bacterium]
MEKSSALYVCAIDIGNRGDNTARVVECVRNADIVFVESFREGGAFLAHAGIRREMLEVSEHSTESELNTYIQRIVSGKLTAAIISDCGAPLVEDPGRTLVRLAYAHGIRVIPLPGASSLTALLMATPFPIKHFTYYGLLPRDRPERNAECRKLAALPYPVVLLDTPYRFNDVLAAIGGTFSHHREIVIGFDLTSAAEEIFYGTLGDAVGRFGAVKQKKREFILVINASGTATAKPRQNG